MKIEQQTPFLSVAKYKPIFQDIWFPPQKNKSSLNTHLLIWSMGSLPEVDPSPPLDSPASSTDETTFSASASELRLASSRRAALTAGAAAAGRMAFTGGRM